MKAIIKVDVPEYQIGQEATVYYRDTMCIKGVCEKEEERKTGKWIPNAVGVYRCSNCHSNMKLKKGRPPKYCDECGYFMIPEEEEEVQEQNCDTCRFTPPGKKWPCEDCLYNDRWEAKIK